MRQVSAGLGQRLSEARSRVPHVQMSLLLSDCLVLLLGYVKKFVFFLCCSWTCLVPFVGFTFCRLAEEVCVFSGRSGVSLFTHLPDLCLLHKRVRPLMAVAILAQRRQLALLHELPQAGHVAKAGHLQNWRQQEEALGVRAVQVHQRGVR